MLKDDKGNPVWKPTLKQERFLSVPLSVKEAFYAGAVNAGKSDVLLMYPIVHGWHNHPQFKGLFLRRTMPELRLEIIPRAKDYFRYFGGVYNKTDAVFTFPSGALYFMGHCEHEDDVHNYDSMQPNYVAFDELTSFTEWIYQYIVIERIRVPDAYKDVLPMIARSGSNPGNIGHQFVYKRFIKPAPEGGKLLIGRGGIKRIFIPATIDDNPHASEQYKKELDALPEAERRAKKFGDWSAYEGQVFDEFRDRHYPGEPENAIHVVPEFEIPEWWPRVVAIDWGFTALTSVGFGAISPNRRVYVYRHLTFQNELIEQWAPQVKYWIERDKPKDVVICHSANQHRGQPHTILEQVTEALEVPVRVGEKDRVGGKMLLHEYLRWKLKPTVPQSEIEAYDPELAVWLLRNKGELEYNRYLNSFKPPELEKNLPKLLLFDNPGCALIGHAIKACIYDKTSKDGKKPEDVAEFDGDDPYDMLRMLLHAVDSFFDEAGEAQKELEARTKIVAQLEATGNLTAYYRNMRTIEQADATHAVNRFAHRKGFYGRSRVH
jgi:hypothetical protein